MMFGKSKFYRDDFPILQTRKPPIYFDNACQTLRPQKVINALLAYLRDYPACAGRSMHHLAARVEQEVQTARAKLAKFLGSKTPQEIIFTRNTTEGINLLANSFAWENGDQVIIGDKEHNSNLVPWLRLAQKKKIKLLICHSNNDGTFSLDNFRQLLEQNSQVRLVSLGLTSNLDGVSIPDKKIVQLAHQKHALVHFDGAQAVPHQSINVNKLDTDFLSFSGHKMLAPSGMGVFYGKAKLLQTLQPFMVGGDTVAATTYHSVEFLPAPEKFEAGLQDYAGIIGLAAAVDYLQQVGMKQIQQTELAINQYLTTQCGQIEGLRLLGPADPKLRGGIFSFYLPGIDCHQIAMLLDKTFNIAVRSGQHCVHSWFAQKKITGSVRASFYFYNTLDEAEQFAQALRKVIDILR